MARLFSWQLMWNQRLRLRERSWRALCRVLATVFYRRVEVSHLERIPDQGGLLVCANHLNSMVDAIVLQAVIGRHLCPLARSGHFSNPGMWPLLFLARALPVYRPQDGSDTAQNEATFASCYQELGASGGVLIFPEGKSHSDPHLKPLKTGAARIALGTLEHAERPPVLVPVSLTFTRPGKFRSSVLVQVGHAVPIAPRRRLGQDAVTVLTNDIFLELEKITINAESWQDLDFLNRLDRFYQRRQGHRPESRPLALRFRTLQKLIERHQQLRLEMPEKVAAVRGKLRGYERLCRVTGHVDGGREVALRPNPGLLLGAMSLALLLLPFALWGALTSGLPYLAARHLGPRLAQKQDQIATSKVLVGLVLLPSTWALILVVVFANVGLLATGLVALTLPPGAAVALFLLRRRTAFLEQLRVLGKMRSRSDVESYIAAKRKELEIEVAELARVARNLERHSALEAAS